MSDSRRYQVEGPSPRTACNMTSWCRVKEADGSTVAYVPDQVTADTIAMLLNKDETIRREADYNADGRLDAMSY